jgi:hypothetical protein
VHNDLIKSGWGIGIGNSHAENDKIALRREADSAPVATSTNIEMKIIDFGR